MRDCQGHDGARCPTGATVARGKRCPACSREHNLTRKRDWQRDARKPAFRMGCACVGPFDGVPCPTGADAVVPKAGGRPSIRCAACRKAREDHQRKQSRLRLVRYCACGKPTQGPYSRACAECCSAARIAGGKQTGTRKPAAPARLCKCGCGVPVGGRGHRYAPKCRAARAALSEIRAAVKRTKVPRPRTFPERLAVRDARKRDSENCPGKARKRAPGRIPGPDPRNGQDGPVPREGEVVTEASLPPVLSLAEVQALTRLTHEQVVYLARRGELVWVPGGFTRESAVAVARHRLPDKWTGPRFAGAQAPAFDGGFREAVLAPGLVVNY